MAVKEKDIKPETEYGNLVEALTLATFSRERLRSDMIEITRMLNEADVPGREGGVEIPAHFRVAYAIRAWQLMKEMCEYWYGEYMRMVDHVYPIPERRIH